MTVTSIPVITVFWHHDICFGITDSKGHCQWCQYFMVSIEPNYTVILCRCLCQLWWNISIYYALAKNAGRSLVDTNHVTDQYYVILAEKSDIGLVYVRHRFYTFWRSFLRERGIWHSMSFRYQKNGFEKSFKMAPVACFYLV